MTTNHPPAATAQKPHAEPVEADQPRVEQGRAAADRQQVGNVDFPVSCDDEAQQEFNHALGLLHHMMYAQAREAFEALAQRDQACAMAHWGIAMTLFHPLWGDPPTPEELERGVSAVAQARQLGLQTSRERAYVDAAAAYYENLAERDEGKRLDRFARAYEELHHSYPDDHDAAAFHALGLLATAPPDDSTYAHQRHAAAILVELHERAPSHPGAIHYGIHAHDFPLMAAAGAFLADIYDAIAPEVPHALHMPSHIYVRLGEWRKTADWNRRSAKAAARHPVDGERSMHYAHAMDYLMYAYLQQMDDERAAAVVDDIDSTADYELAPPTAYAIAAIHARPPLEQRDWERAAQLDTEAIAAEVPWAEMPFARAVLVYSRGLGAVRSGDLTTARQALAQLKSIADELEVAGQETSTLRYWHRRALVQRDTVAAWIAHAEGVHEHARELMRRVAEREGAAGKHPTMPAFILPARELLADMLLAQDRPEQALDAYRTSLREFPRRANSLHGALVAARQLGQRAIALDYAVRLVVMAASPDADRPILREARKYLVTPRSRDVERATRPRTSIVPRDQSAHNPRARGAKGKG